MIYANIFDKILWKNTLIITLDFIPIKFLSEQEGYWVDLTALSIATSAPTINPVDFEIDYDVTLKGN